MIVVMKEGDEGDLEEGGGGFNIMGSFRYRHSLRRRNM